MRHRLTQLLADPPPQGAEVYGNIKFARIDDGPITGGAVCYVKAWRGKQSKPYAHYRFKNSEKREEWIAEQKASEDADQQFKLERKLANSRALQDMMAQIQVGTLLHYSWGYDQTQCDYFQVVSRKGRCVVLREIGSETVPGSEGFMSDRRRPCPGKFIGEPFAKVIQPHGITMKYGIATPTEAGQAHYCSWYA